MQPSARSQYAFAKDEAAANAVRAAGKIVSKGIEAGGKKFVQHAINLQSRARAAENKQAESLMAREQRARAAKPQPASGKFLQMQEQKRATEFAQTLSRGERPKAGPSVSSSQMKGAGAAPTTGANS